jgi:hypothetical protein
MGLSFLLARRARRCAFNDGGTTKSPRVRGGGLFALRHAARASARSRAFKSHCAIDALYVVPWKKHSGIIDSRPMKDEGESGQGTERHSDQ